MEFIFDDCLMESIDVTSLEDMDITEIIRENAHAMLDIREDLESIMMEGIGDTLKKGKDAVVDWFKKAFAKIKAMWKKFIAWIKAIFKKTEKELDSVTIEKSDDGTTKSLPAGIDGTESPTYRSVRHADPEPAKYHDISTQVNSATHGYKELSDDKDKAYYSNLIEINYGWFKLSQIVANLDGLLNRITINAANVNDNVSVADVFNEEINFVKHVTQSNYEYCNIREHIVRSTGEFQKLDTILYITPLNEFRNKIDMSEEAVLPKIVAITDETMKKEYATNVVQLLSLASNELTNAYRHNLQIVKAAKLQYIKEMHKYGYIIKK